MRGIAWTEEVYSEFLSLAILSDGEKAVLDSIVKRGRTIVGTAQLLNMSEPSVDVTIRHIKQQYRYCMKFSSILAAAWIQDH